MGGKWRSPSPWGLGTAAFDEEYPRAEALLKIAWQ
jgi:hypothetical protein